MALGEWNDGVAARALNRYCLKNTAGDLNTTGHVTGFVPCYAIEYFEDNWNTTGRVTGFVPCYAIK